MRAAIGNRTRPNSGVQPRHSPPALELAPWSAGRGATDLHGGAQARIQACIQARVNGCVRRTATYACGVAHSHAPDLGRERSPLAAGWGARTLAGRAWCDRPAQRGSGKKTSMHVNECVMPAAIYACGVGKLHTPDLGRESSPLAAGWGTRPLVAQSWCVRRASRGSGKNTSTREQMHKAYSKICVRR